MYLRGAKHISSKLARLEGEGEGPRSHDEVEDAGEQSQLDGWLSRRADGTGTVSFVGTAILDRVTPDRENWYIL